MITWKMIDLVGIQTRAAASTWHLCSLDNRWTYHLHLTFLSSFIHCFSISNKRGRFGWLSPFQIQSISVCVWGGSCKNRTCVNVVMVWTSQIWSYLPITYTVIWYCAAILCFFHCSDKTIPGFDLENRHKNMELRICDRVSPSEMKI